MSKLLMFPAIVAIVGFRCTPDTVTDYSIESDLTEVRISATVNAINADIDGLEGLSLKLTPAPTCAGYWTDADEEGLSPWVEVLPLDQLHLPDGSPVADGPNAYQQILGESTIIDAVPGCYDVVAVPVDAAGEPLLNCITRSIPVVVDDLASIVVDPPIYCASLPRTEMDVLDGNFAPHINELTVSPLASSCEVSKVCATASDADYDLIEFEWPQPEGIDQGSFVTAPWPTIVEHRVNDDNSVTQCIAVQAHEPGTYDIEVNVYDVVRLTPYDPPMHIEDLWGMASSASESTTLDATLACDPTGRSAAVLLTLDNDPGLTEADAKTLIANSVAWLTEGVAPPPAVLVVLDDNHHGEDWQDGEFVYGHIQSLGVLADYMLEPETGLLPTDVEGYDLVWFVNPGYEMDDLDTHTTLTRYRQEGGAVMLQGDDIARFRGNAQFMEPLTYLSWQANGTLACGAQIDNNQYDSYAVAVAPEYATNHPMLAGLEQLEFKYGNDIDLTRALNKGEQVLAWAEYETPSCVVRTPAIVALDPEQLLAW